MTLYGTNRRRNRQALLSACAMITGFMLPQSATAQTAETTAQEANSAFGDIVVTARRRNENLQDVPVAITAFSGANLATRNISDVTALDGLAPNVKVVESGTNTTSYIQIRGSVTTNPNPGYEPAAAMYIDGVYIGKAAGSTVDLADIEHIEVLRGPQGTLFGRNTLAGAINIVTKKPSGEWGGSVKAGVGSYDRRRVQASLDLPEFSNISIKLSGLLSHQHGYIHVADNPFADIPTPPKTVKRLGDDESQAFRAAVRYQPTSELTFDYAFDYNHMRTTPDQGTLQSVGADGIFDPTSLNYINVPLYLYLQPQDRPTTSYGTGGVDNRELLERVKIHNHALTATWELGATTLKSITAYREMQWEQSLDLDGSPLPLAAAGSDLDYHQFSQELQASGKVGRLTYTGGVYYFRDKGDVANPQQFFGNKVDSNAIFKTKAYAVYGQVDYTPPILDDKLVLTAGYRYSHEEKSINRYAADGGVVTIPVGTAATETFKGSTPTFVAKYAFSPAFNIYAKYSEGFKSGGFTADAVELIASTTPYEPEIVKSIELGAKARLFDGKLRVNAAAFFDKHDDQQIAIFTPRESGFVTLTANGARSKIKGFELEVQANPVDWLIVSGNLGHTDPRFTEYFAVTGGPNVASTQSFAFVPRWTASGSLDARVAQTSAVQVNLGIDINYSTKYAALPYSTDPAVNPNIYSTQAGAATIVDGRIVFSKIALGSSELQVTAFTKNLFNISERTAGIDFGSAFGNIVTRNYNKPRTFGLDATVKF